MDEDGKRRLPCLCEVVSKIPWEPRLAQPPTDPHRHSESEIEHIGPHLRQRKSQQMAVFYYVELLELSVDMLRQCHPRLVTVQRLELTAAPAVRDHRPHSR